MTPLFSKLSAVADQQETS